MNLRKRRRERQIERTRKKEIEGGTERDIERENDSEWGKEACERRLL